MIEWIMVLVLTLSTLFVSLYCRFLLKNLVTLSEAIKDIKTLINGFKKHVEQLHELEMFYGDETLKSMIDHSKYVVGEIDKYEDALSLTEQETETSYEKKEEE